MNFFSKKHLHLSFLLLTSIFVIILIFLSIVVRAVDGSIWAHRFVMDIELSNVDGSFLGEAASDLTGNFTGVGDVNGDGLADIFIGSSGNDGVASNAGKAYLILGKSSGWAMNTQLSVNANIDASFLGENASDSAGQSVAMIGDVNGDGYGDMAVGARQNSEATTTAGQVYVIFGKANGWSKDVSLASAAGGSFLGNYMGAQISDEIDSLGDVNSDGYGDFIFCSNTDDQYGNNTGECFLVLGKATGSWTMDQNIATAGVITQTYVGSAVEDLLGTKAAGIGDINGDGYDDFAMGATGNDDAGADRGQAYIFFGHSGVWTNGTSTAYSSSGATFVGENDSDFAGFGMAGLGDVNGDGLDDFAITSNGYDNGGTANVGKVYIFFGRANDWSKGVSLATADASYIGEALSDFVDLVASAGDVNNDGLKDILISDEHSDPDGSNSGQTYLILGKTTGWSQNVNLGSVDASFFGETAGDFSGRHITNGGDLNGDGASDFIIAAYANDETASNAGQVYVVLSQKPPVVSLSSATVAADGTGVVSVTTTVSDTNFNSQALRVRYVAGTNCAATSTSAATLGSTVSVTYADSGGVPTVSTTASFQIGSETSKKIITSSGTNTVGFVWNSATDLPAGDSTYCLLVSATDGAAYSTIASTTLTIDNVTPTTPGALSAVTIASSSVKFSLGAASTETNFREYKIIYGTSSPLTSTGSAFTSSSDANLGSRTFNSVASSTVTGLTPNTAYYFNIFSYDQYGHVASSTSEVSLTTLAAVPISLAATTVSPSSVRAAWSGNGNTADTEYFAQNVTTGSNSGWITGTEWAEGALRCGGTFEYRVKTRSRSGLETDWTDSVIGQTSSCGQSGFTPPAEEISPTPPTPIVPVVEVPVETPPQAVIFVEPKENTSISVLPFVVRGRAAPGSVVWVHIANSRYEVTADAQGNFAITILDDLPAGPYIVGVEGENSPLVERKIMYAPVGRVIPVKPTKPVPDKGGIVPPVSPEQSATPTPTPPVIAVDSTALIEKENRSAFFLVLRDRLHFQDDQVQEIETAHGNTINFILRPSKNVHSITARLYSNETGSEKKRSPLSRLLKWFFGEPVLAAREGEWVASSVFSLGDVTNVYEGDMLIPDVRGGVYTLQITMNETGGKRTTINKQMTIVSKGAIYSGSATDVNTRIAGARITVYDQKPDGTFAVWAGGGSASFQPGVFFTDKTGEYAITVPSGTYYMTVDAPGYRSYESAISHHNSTSVLHDNIHLDRVDTWWQRLLRWLRELFSF